MKFNVVSLLLFGSIMLTTLAFRRSSLTVTFTRKILGDSVRKTCRHNSNGDSIPRTVIPMQVKDFGNILKDSDVRQTYQIVDVREENELEQVSIPGVNVVHLPLSDAQSWTQKVMEGSLLDNEKPTLCLCHHGMRSLRVANFLLGQAGFDEVYNIEGGIDAYAASVDSSIGRY